MSIIGIQIIINNLGLPSIEETLLKFRWSWHRDGKIQKKTNYHVLSPFYD